jgi:NADPH-dependent 2,4-dienoyl-CoA reductase/sulfur reductase-like enzyme
MRLLIIGGSDAGIAAALRAREVNPEAEVTVVVADAYPNYSICGLPFYLSGEVEDHRDLAHRSAEEIEEQGISILTDHTAREINADARTVEVADSEGRVRELSYDRLVIGAGAEPARPNISGLDIPGVYSLHSMHDSFRMHRHLTEQEPRTAVIVGGGYIGLEMADALTLRGIQVTIMGRAKSMLPTVDTTLGQEVEEELRRHGVEVFTRTEAQAIEQDGKRLSVSGSTGFHRSADLVLIAAGVRPNTELAEGCGVQTGIEGAIRVNRRMETGVDGVYAAGDCIETYHQLLGRNDYLPLGTTAHKQGRVAGENAVCDDGENREFVGSLGTQVVKVFELVIARTGLLEDEARDAGFESLTTATEAYDHKQYYPGARKLRLRLTAERTTGRLLGAQILGPWGAEIAKRIDVFATALYHQMRVEDLNDLDLSYTPPIGAPWDAVQAAAQTWQNSNREFAPT